MAVALVEAAVRASVRNKAPRRTTAAVASATAKAVLAAGRCAGALGGPDVPSGAASAACSGPAASAASPGAATPCFASSSCDVRSRRAARRLRKKQRRAARQAGAVAGAAEAAMAVDDSSRTDLEGSPAGVGAPPSLEAPGAGAVASRSPSRSVSAPGPPAKDPVPILMVATPKARASPPRDPAGSSGPIAEAGSLPASLELPNEVLYSRDGTFEATAYPLGSQVSVMGGRLAGSQGVVVGTSAGLLTLRIKGRGDVVVDSIFCPRSS